MAPSSHEYHLCCILVCTSAEDDIMDLFVIRPWHGSTGNKLDLQAERYALQCAILSLCCLRAGPPVSMYCYVLQVSRGNTSTLAQLGTLERLLLWQLSLEECKMSPAEAASELMSACWPSHQLALGLPCFPAAPQDLAACINIPPILV